MSRLRSRVEPIPHGGRRRVPAVATGGSRNFRWRNLWGFLFRRASSGQHVSEDPALGDVLDVLSDEYARAILAATSVKPMSAQQLADECEMSKPTVYRRVERLRDYDLIEERTAIQDDGNHYSVYAATLSELSVELDEGSFEADVTRREPEAFPGQRETDTADRFAKMWENL